MVASKLSPPSTSDTSNVHLLDQETSSEDNISVDLSHFFSDGNKTPSPIPSLTSTIKAGSDNEEEDVEIKRNKFIIPGLSGLSNMGNTCYMNSTLQCLASLPLLNYHVRNDKYEKSLRNNKMEMIAKKLRERYDKGQHDTINVSGKMIQAVCENSITYQLSRLFKYMWKENCTINPKTFKEAIGRANSEFSGWGQNDSQELLNLILDNIHEDTKTSVVLEYCNIPPEVKQLLDVRSNTMTIMKDPNISPEQKDKTKKRYKTYRQENYEATIILDAYIYWKTLIRDSHSIITDLFTGLFFSEITCNTCHQKSSKFESFTSLSVETPTDGETTMEECLKEFSKEEELIGNNQYFCDNCKSKVDAKKKLYIWEAPEILIVHLKRFKTTYISPNKTETSKTNSKITFPMKGLSLDNNFSVIHKDSSDSNYTLWSIILHEGGCKGGHYKAYCRNSINKLWYEFNDSTVVHHPDEDIEKEVVNNNSYVMFYVRDLS